MSSINEVEILKRRAYEFLRHAQDALDHGEFDLACFFAEQAVQLRVKSLILKMLGYVPRTHSVRELLGILIKALFDLARDKANLIMELASRERAWLKVLEDAYIAARYGLREYDLDEARHCVELARTIIELLDAIDRCVGRERPGH